MIDIHTHLLPGMDDGVGDVDEALRVLDLQRQCGVDKVFLTPHYYPERMALEDFLNMRAAAWAQLRQRLPADWKEDLRLGAEVHLSQRLLEQDLRQLTLEQSDYLLLELPRDGYPACAERVIAYLQEKGVVPILAHVERFRYFREDPGLLRKLIRMGAVGQVTADAIFSFRDRGFAGACMKHDLAQIAASDAHNDRERRPCMDQLGKLPEPLRQKAEFFAQAVWDNEVPPPVRPSGIRKGLFGYY